MTFIDSLVTALFVMAVVFSVLVVLLFIVRLFSALIRVIESKASQSSSK